MTVGLDVCLVIPQSITMYADDLVVFSPSSAGFQKLLNICSDYGIRYDVQCNTKKSVAMIRRTTEHRDLNFPDFYLFKFF